MQRNKNVKVQPPQNRKEFETAQSVNNKIMAVSQSHDILPIEQPKTGIVSPNEFNEHQMNEMLRNSNLD